MFKKTLRKTVSRIKSNGILLSLAVVLLSMIFILSGCTNTTDKDIDSKSGIGGDKSDLSQSAYPEKLDWYIPDGLRADPETFDVFKWANEGKLPNIKRMMDEGSYGYSIPVYPSHTPTNFAALLTGTYPMTNGIADGPMRIEGQTLAKPAVAGFSSAARKVPAIWSEFEKDGKKIILLSLPGSTAPEIKNNAVTIRGRWGGWGADFHSVVFEKKSLEQRKKLARNSRLFFLGMELTQYIDAKNNTWPSEFRNVDEIYIPMTLNGATIHAKMQGITSNDGTTTYDKIIFSRDMKTIDASLREGEWSDWFPINFTWNNKTVESHVKYNVIMVGPGDFFRVRVLVDNMNAFIVDPSNAAAEIELDVGPMVDFVDNFPPQLVYYPNDKDTFLSEMQQSFEWHKTAIDSIYAKYHPDIFIHDTYSQNQMLTSKWWMGYVDPKSKRYNDVSEKERAQLMKEVEDMYKETDAIVGKILDNADENTLIVFSSDHGAIPLDKAVQLNNLFAQKGWINYTMNPNTGEQIIDWNTSKVVFLKMDNLYINPKGLGPVWNRGSGPEYEKLRDEVIKSLEDLRDADGSKPLAAAVKWEDVKEVLKLPVDRSGDIVIANNPGYGWTEDITEDGKIFEEPLETGYKQAIFAENVTGLWTPFIIVGKGVKKNHMIAQPIVNVDQAPTILYAMNKTIPSYMEGKVVYEIFEEKK